MTALNRVSLIIMLFILPSTLKGQGITTLLKGRVEGIESDALILVRETGDIASGKEIPVTGGHFKYKLEVEYLEKYEIIISEELHKGYFRPVQFFPDTSTIEFIIYPYRNSEKTKVSGGTLNERMKSFNRKTEERFLPEYRRIEKAMDSLRSAHKIYSSKYTRLLVRISEATGEEEADRLEGKREKMIISGEAYTEEANSLINETDSLNHRMVNWQKDYIKANDDIFAYSLLLSLTLQYPVYGDLIDTGFLEERFGSFREKYPGHPYTRKMEKILTELSSFQQDSRM